MTPQKKEILWLKMILIFLSAVSLYAQESQLTEEVSLIFGGSGNCTECHETNGEILFSNGKDISPIGQWRSTMMANSAKDPLWRAKVSAEVKESPARKKEIENKCTKCHSPMGYTRATKEKFQEHFSLHEMEKSELALDGVSCTVCHQIQNKNFGEPSSFTGGYFIDFSNIIFGPYKNPLPGPMINNTSFTPKYASFVNDSELCATCHTLYTEYRDDTGKVLGSFPEQVPYLEWKNSIFPSLDLNCQTCHMPQINTPTDISVFPPWHEVQRTPYWQHTFVGGNVFMLKLLKNNRVALKLSASEQEFNSTIKHTQKQLKNETLNLSLTPNHTPTSLEIRVKIQNLSGHKLPTGIPLRRMWIHFKVQEEEGNVIFESGQWDQNGEILHLDPHYEPHYDVIDQEHQVQIYEGIMKDVRQQMTYTLLNAAGYLKDNRIPPLGFLSDHTNYSDTAIVGQASKDPNFNRSEGEEGSGSDEVTYRVSCEAQKNYQVTVQICYQTVTPRFIQHLFGFSTSEIEIFRKMYQREEKAPVILKSMSLHLPKNSRTD